MLLQCLDSLLLLLRVLFQSNDLCLVVLRDLPQALKSSPIYPTKLSFFTFTFTFTFFVGLFHALRAI